MLRQQQFCINTLRVPVWIKFLWTRMTNIVCASVGTAARATTAFPQSPLRQKGGAVCVLVLLAIIIGFGSAFMANSASPAPPPKGLLEEPQLGGFDIAPLETNREAGTTANLQKEFTFKGWVDFPPGEGELSIFVRCDGDNYPGNGTLTVRTAQPSNITKSVNGQTVWTFSIGPFKPFQEAVNNKLGVWCGQPWLDGGTARVGIVAYRYRDGASSELPFLDRDGYRLAFHDLIFADYSLTPATQDLYVPAPLYPYPAYLGMKPRESKQDTENYYKAVLTDEKGEDTRRSLWDALPTLKKFKERYFENPSICSDKDSNSSNNLRVDAPPAIYFNQGDLAIGREMHCNYNDCTKETACYVKNYDGADGIARFLGVKSVSQQAIDAKKPFATVAMVSRGKMPPDAANKVFFAVYGHKYTSNTDPLVVQDSSPLALEARLDYGAYNTFIPGNCLVCHGSHGSYVNGKVSNAYFLPFDLEHGLDYYSTDPSNPLSRAAQEAKFKRLNQIVATTDLYRELPHARVLLNKFYGAPENFTFDPRNPIPPWPSATFQDNRIPDGWYTGGIDTQQIYRKVVAPYCRTCHISNNSDIFNFGTWDQFRDLAFKIRTLLCATHDNNIMPNAEVTSNRFWRSDARAHFVSRMNAAGCGLESRE
jgi:hypothetical protein